MIHKYKMNGHNIVLDVNGGSVHVFDDISYDVLDYYKDLSADEIVEKLAQYPEESVRDSIKEIAELEKANMLCSSDDYLHIEDFKKREPVL